MNGGTDWDAYYERPAWPSRLTRRFTAQRLLDLLRHYGGAPADICELGGANSCFLDDVRRLFPQARYTVVDNNDTGLELLARRMHSSAGITLLRQDIRDLPDTLLTADVVFSVGLIEHFDPADTARVVAKHFAILKPGGVAVISFPTPTWLYRGTRRMAELGGVWRFPDERPLRFSEVARAVVPYADILHTTINWPIVLTQGLLVARRRAL